MSLTTSKKIPKFIDLNTKEANQYMKKIFLMLLEQLKIQEYYHQN